MPLYLFKCVCGEELELELSMKDSGMKQNCPICCKEMYRDYNYGAMEFIGGGFYVNDYKTDLEKMTGKKPRDLKKNP